MRYKSRRYGGRSRRRGLTAAQQAAHDKAYDSCDHTVSGSFAKGMHVSDHFGRKCWKVVTYGIRYHEDVSSCIYGVRPSNGPKGWRDCVVIREAIESVIVSGTDEPGSRAGEPGSREPRPSGDKLASWTDARHDSYATCETITVYDGGIIGVVRPIYDDSPIIRWVKDRKLAGRLLKAIEKCPKPITVPTATVKERTVDLKIEESHPRFAAYMAARNAEHYPSSDLGAAGRIESRIVMPRSEHRRIKAELDAAENSVDKA